MPVSDECSCSRAEYLTQSSLDIEPELFTVTACKDAAACTGIDLNGTGRRLILEFEIDLKSDTGVA